MFPKSATDVLLASSLLLSLTSCTAYPLGPETFGGLYLTKLSGNVAFARSSGVPVAQSGTDSISVATASRQTVSIGFARLAAGESASALLRRADQALYRAKSLGKDQVFDVLGDVLPGNELRDLLIQAIRYGDQPDVRAQIDQVIDAIRRSAREKAWIAEVDGERAGSVFVEIGRAHV